MEGERVDGDSQIGGGGFIVVAFAQQNAATLDFASSHASVVAEATANAAELTQPSGVSLDAAGDLFISDSGNNVIREVVKATGATAE